jgi:hypothetical protein
LPVTPCFLSAVDLRAFAVAAERPPGF